MTRFSYEQRWAVYLDRYQVRALSAPPSILPLYSLELNRSRGFDHGPALVGEQIRLLSLECDSTREEPKVSLRIYDLTSQVCVDVPGYEITNDVATLPVTDPEARHHPYIALSYMWGSADCPSDVETIKVNGQDFAVRRNLSQFLEDLHDRSVRGWYFIDAICINRNSDDERSKQVAVMSRIYGSAGQVVIWLGGSRKWKDAKALGDVVSVENTPSWSEPKWSTFISLRADPYWGRLWILQELRLARQ
ncbi:MAG: hypothetical protein OHK93_004996 [Ramalina farinacea]|uniref:Heterokaryon incompatibility domain-containing protein n=1 Tax=Ramalina farinacea TaxID=258253 RepID=A0AA43QYF8_9LECA|nr:hypothetical protein [Ramalina farinacea]